MKVRGFRVRERDALDEREKETKVRERERGTHRMERKRDKRMGERDTHRRQTKKMEASRIEPLTHL
jgi:hypothetical protein